MLKVRGTNPSNWLVIHSAMLGILLEFLSASWKGAKQLGVTRFPFELGAHLSNSRIEML